jgi:iron complex transport system substrate-binding protein
VRLYHSVNEACRTYAPGTIEADWTNAAGVINVSVGTSLRGKGNKNFADIELDKDMIDKILGNKGMRHSTS